MQNARLQKIQFGNKWISEAKKLNTSGEKLRNQAKLGELERIFHQIR